MIFDTIKITDTESTNTELKRMAAEGAKVGTVLVSERQSGGRGRLGRSFSSEKGGLYVSIILPYDSNVGAGLLTTFAAVAAARAIKRVSGAPVGIKWVNDLYLGGKKLCGILAEGVTCKDGQRAILGIGVNLTNPIPNELSDIATSLFDECGTAVSPDDLLNALLDELSDFENTDFEKILGEYRHNCLTLGKEIEVIPHSGEKYSAIALDILHDGSLLVRRTDNGKEMRVFSGEVSTKIGGSSR